MYKIKKLIHQYGNTRALDAATIALLVSTKIQDTVLIPEICQTLKSIFDLQECGFFWSDSNGAFIDAWCTSPHFLNFNTLSSCAKFQAEGERNWPTFTENVLAGPVCGYLLPFQHEGLYASAHFKMVYEPLGVKYILDLVLHDGERPYGAFLMMRSLSQGSFSSEERDFLVGLISVLNGVFHAETSEVTYSDKLNVGFSVVSEDGEVNHIDSIASSVIWALAYDQPGSFASPDAPPLNRQLEKIIAPHLQQALKGERLFFSVKNRWGCFNVTLEKQFPSRQISVQLQKRVPLYTEIVNKLHLMKLTPMQHLVAYLLALNESRQEIAELLGISIETVTSHIKSIYKHTETHSSHSLLLKLIG